MSGEDEDRLDFGEDEELEDQISLGDAEDAAAGWSAGQQQEGVASNGHAQSSKGDDTSRGGADSIGNQTAVQDSNDGEEPLPPGWVTRTSRQGELYYFHEPTTLSQWDRPTASSASVTEDASPATTDAKSGASVPVASAAVQAATTAAADSSSHGMSLHAPSNECRRRKPPYGPLVDSPSHLTLLSTSHSHFLSCALPWPVIPA